MSRLIFTFIFNYMKQLLLTALAILFTAGVNAQINTPRELQCTEEAFTFKASLSSGWHFSKVIMGHPEMMTSTPDFVPVNSLELNEALRKKQLPETIQKQLSTIRFRYMLDQSVPNKVLFPYPGNIKINEGLNYLYPYNLTFQQSFDYNGIKSTVPAN